MTVQFILQKLKLVLICFGVGALGGALLVSMCYFFGVNLNSSQRWLTFWAFALFGLIAGIVNTLTIKMPK